MALLGYMNDFLFFFPIRPNLQISSPEIKFRRRLKKITTKIRAREPERRREKSPRPDGREQAIRGLLTESLARSLKESLGRQY